MDDQDNIQSLKTLYAAFIRGDIHSVLGFFSDDLDFQHPMPQSIWPWAGKRLGRTGLAEFIEGLNPLIEYEQFEPREYIAQGDRVAVLFFEHGRIKATGVTFDNYYVHVFKFKEGKIVQFLIFEDTAPIIAALRVTR
jgi:uncharacterized protein